MKPARLAIQLVIATTLGLSCMAARGAAGATLQSGDILVADFGRDAIFQIDSVTGNRTTLTGAGVGTGPALRQPRGVAVDSLGRVYVADADSSVSAVVRVDPVTGNRTVLSSASAGSGDDFLAPFALAFDPAGNLFVSDLLGDAILRVDVHNGHREIVSGPSVGTGPLLGNPAAIGFDSAGLLLVADQTLDAIVQVDVVSGNRTILSGSGMSGPSLDGAVGMTVGPGGEVFASVALSQSLLEILPDGNRQTVSGAGTGSGPAFSDLRGIAVDESGQLIAVDEDLDAVIRVNPTTGERAMLSSGEMGTGPMLVTPDAVTVVGPLLTGGDYNGDGVIDAADYTTWRDALGTSAVLANDPTPGAVDATDYTLWKIHYGTTTGQSAAIASHAPEPATMILLGTCLLAMFFSGRRSG